MSFLHYCREVDERHPARGESSRASTQPSCWWRTRLKSSTFYVVLVILIATIAEVSACAITPLVVKRGWMASMPEFAPSQVDRYLTQRTSLGWGPPMAASVVATLRARRDSEQANAPCASAYGDSFTAGSGVADDDTYPHELGVIVGCGVANYGVGGYGSDQAFMLWRAQRHQDHARVVILGHLSENILRNVNQYRNLLYPGQEWFFKPRFVLDGDTLREIPIVVQRRDDFAALMRDPASVLHHEAFLSRPRRGFPNSIAIARWALQDFHVRAKLARVPRHEPFYRADHPTGALQLTSRILAAFAAEARAGGQSPFVVLIPMGDDFAYAIRMNRWPDQPLADALRETGVSVIHAGPSMLSRLQGENACKLFSDCNGHYNALGYRMLAEVVADSVQNAINASRDARLSMPHIQ